MKNKEVILTKKQRSELDIDLQHLEDECKGHSRRVIYWGIKFAKAKRVVRRLKNKIKARRAEIAREIRRRPRNFQVDRATEGVIEDVCYSHQDYRMLQNDLVRAEYEQDVLEAMMKALYERGQDLGHEVKLFLGMYWSKPDTSAKNPGAKRAMEEAGKLVED
jgi:hypothetical protein